MEGVLLSLANHAKPQSRKEQHADFTVFVENPA
jgi:hypothetical protein